VRERDVVAITEGSQIGGLHIVYLVQNDADYALLSIVARRSQPDTEDPVLGAGSVPSGERLNRA